MSYEIRALSPADVADLSRFLIQGFGTAPDAPFAAPDVLRWKYFDPRGDRGAPRSWVAVEQGRLVGHLGLCPSAFLGAGLPGGEVATLHMIDWLSAQPGSGVGARLMLRGHQGVPTAYGFGGSAAGRAVIGGGGYKLVGTVPVYQRVLRHAPAWRAGRFGRGAKDLVRALTHRPRAPRACVGLRPVPVFGPEVEPVLAAYGRTAIFTDRRPALLNHLLRYPRGGVTGWHLTQGERVRGCAVLSLVEQGATRAAGEPTPAAPSEEPASDHRSPRERSPAERGEGEVRAEPAHDDAGRRQRSARPTCTGRVVDCVLDEPDPALWHAALFALAGELKRQGAHTATAFASTGWSADALRACGFVTRHALEFRLRDKGRLIPAGAVFHLTPLEADYAYT